MDKWIKGRKFESHSRNFSFPSLERKGWFNNFLINIFKKIRFTLKTKESRDIAG